MPTQKVRFTPPPARAPLRQREVSLPVIGGLHAGIAPQDVPRGFTPDARNLVPRVDGFMTPRSGLSQGDTFDFNGVVLGAAETIDVDGNFGGVAMSALSAAYLHPDNFTWSTLSYIAGNIAAHQGNLSGTSDDYFEAETIYDPVSDNNLVVFSNNTDSSKWFSIISNTTTFSDFTWTNPIDEISTFKDISSVNDRLVMFNVQSSNGTRFPTRVLWSARGNPRSYLISDGAGAEDLKDMRGTGTAVVRFRDFLILFTEVEIWRATPTLDAYAFRFDRVVDNVGCEFPRTISVTPHGVFFLGSDREIHATDGSRLIPLGPVDGTGPSRIQRKLRDELLAPSRAWSIYNQTYNRFEFYYSASDSPSGFPSRALFYSLEDRTWWPQRFSLGLSAGADLSDPVTSLTWDDVTDSWDATTTDWESFNLVSGNRRVNVFTSTGSTLRFRTDQTDDDGTAIDWRWEAPGKPIRGNGISKVHLKEVWLEGENDASSAASIYVGSSRGTARTDPTAISITTTGEPVFVPVWRTDYTPAFEIRGNDGGQPRISGFRAVVQDASRF